MSSYDLTFSVNDQYYNTLEIDSFSKMLKDPSYCYKFYWLEAIVNLVNSNVTSTTMDAIIDEMIANAWYSVTEFHIHLSGLVNGEARDGLERAINHLNDLSGLTSSASKIEIKEAIKKYNNELRTDKVQLTNMVPYRALSGFFDNHGVRVNWEKRTELIAYISQFNQNVTKLLYTFGEGSALQREIEFDPNWIKLINDNTVEILGWIQYEKLRWLQNNNPEVPGLVYKLRAGDNVRKLDRVRKLWSGIMEITHVRDIYTGNEIDPNNYDVDHFVPWSFVMNDELWNLMPMDSSLNSSKNNNLPEWDAFFKNFASNQFVMYQMIFDREGIHSLFEKCFKDNLHSIWAQQELYRQGNDREVFYNILSTNMKPVYDSAKRQGYQIWKVNNNEFEFFG